MFPWIFPSCYQPDAMSVAILSLGSLSSFCGLIWEPLLCLAQGCEKMFAQLASRDVGSSVSIFGGGCQPRAHSHVGLPGRPNLKPSKSRPGPPRKPPTRSTTVAIGVGLGSKSRKRPNRNRKRVRGITLAGHLAPESQPPSRLGKRKAPPTTQAGTRGKNMSMMAAIGALFGNNSVEVGNPPMKARRGTMAPDLWVGTLGRQIQKVPLARSTSQGTSTAPAGNLKQPAIGGQTIAQWLEALRLSQLAATTWKKGKLCVDLFSGPRSPIGREVGKRGGAYIAFDILIDKRFDLTNPEVEKVLMAWIVQGFVWAVWLGTDCTTWSRASYSKGPGWLNSYRRKVNVWGEPSLLSAKAKEKVAQGNNHALLSLRLLEQVAGQPWVAAGMENPAGSAIWLLPEILALEKRYPSKIHRSTCHYCQYGKPWQKATTFLWVATPEATAPKKKCQPRGCICSRTGRPHTRLGKGRCHLSSGKQLTLVAQPYPAQLAATLVDCLAGVF